MTMELVLVSERHQMRVESRYCLALLGCLINVAASGCAEGDQTVAGEGVSKSQAPSLEEFDNLFSPNRQLARDSQRRIVDQWHPGNAVMLMESIRVLRQWKTGMSLFDALRQGTGQEFDNSLDEWYAWQWMQEPDFHPRYADFKAQVYSRLDKRFAEYFSSDRSSIIRLDEIRWGGVKRDGIPPLKDPTLETVDEADWLAETDVVFGVEFNGEAIAWPKRILAWHEMVKMTVGGESICGVYCTLCGSVIVYETHVDSVHHELGTSGFLYRSNKLMYDHATKSLWSTIEGQPVVGQLVGKDIELKRKTVVTTTWGEWKRRHPETKVLSLATGHRRDYSEGAAYRRYFATDRLMFNVPLHDERLKNKQSVLALRSEIEPADRLAITTDFLADHPVYHDTIGGVGFVVLTDESGASRVFRDDDQRIVEFDGNSTATDTQGDTWTMSETSLDSSSGQSLERLPSHNAFWFGWVNAYPDTRLVTHHRKQDQ